MVPGKCLYPIASYDTCDHFSAKHQRILVVVQTEVEPTRFLEVVKSPHWHTAIKQEIDALVKDGTWKITSLPPTKRALNANGCVKSSLS